MPVLSLGGGAGMRLVADANVLLSAVLGGRAGLILNHPRVLEVLTTDSTFAEVQEYASHLARNRRLSLDVLLLAVASLPVTVVEPEVYAAKLPEAEKQIGRRDRCDSRSYDLDRPDSHKGNASAPELPSVRSWFQRAALAARENRRSAGGHSARRS